MNRDKIFWEIVIMTLQFGAQSLRFWLLNSWYGFNIIVFASSL